MNPDFEYNHSEGTEEVGCPSTGYQDIQVCVPVTIKPFGEVGNAKVQCLGKPEIRPGCASCDGIPDGTCQFTISQKLRIQVPVVFGARAEAGPASVACGCTGSVEEEHPSDP